MRKTNGQLPYVENLYHAFQVHSPFFRFMHDGDGFFLPDNMFASNRSKTFILAQAQGSFAFNHFFRIQCFCFNADSRMRIIGSIPEFSGFS